MKRTESLMRRVLTAAIAATAVACSFGDTYFETVDEPITMPSPTKTCEAPFATPDMSKLKACGDGKGHCYAENKTALVGLPACEGGEVCVPDKVLALHGDKLKPCKFFIEGKPGVCMSMLVGQVAEHKGQLKQDVCDDDERCIPCIDPTKNADTHVCEAGGVYENACKGGAADMPITCCHGAGVCLNKEAVPPEQRDKVTPQSCPGQKICAPAAAASGHPVSCNALGLGGVCLDLCFATQLAPTARFVRGGCQATEVCRPCAIGSGEGMPGC